MLSWAALAVMVAIFLVWCWWDASGYGGNNQGSVLAYADRDYQAETYDFDGIIYLRTFRFLQGGLGYHEAFARAFLEDARHETLPVTVTGWRTPFLAWLWGTVLPERGSAVVILFIGASAVTLVVAYALGARLGTRATALVPVVLLMPYFHYAATSRWFPMHEWWGSFWALASITAFAYRRMYLAALLALPALLTRELFVFLAVAGWVACISARHWRGALAWAATGVTFLIYYLWHWSEVSQLVALQPIAAATDNGEANGITFLAFTVAYGWVQPAGPFSPLAAGVPLLGGVGLFFIREQSMRTVVIGTVGLATLFFLVMGYLHHHYSYYWGAVSGPFLLLGYAPLTAAAFQRRLLLGSLFR
ncbi:MAG: hypothetical protein CL878_05725 [Dehalococcoidia bacterium]|nr:hypothetical protein [Dehalococcoidia bacterium]